MGAAENLATHKAWTAAEDDQDLTRHDQFVHDDIVVNQAGAEPVVGLDGYITMMEGTYAGLPDFHVVLEDQFATDDRVVCR
jgi:predicted ester cyclase